MNLIRKEEIQLRLSWDLTRRVAVQCYIRGISFEEYVEMALRQGIEDSKNKHGSMA